MRPFSPHFRFFSSLQQVEDRLATEGSRRRAEIESSPTVKAPPPQPPFASPSSSEHQLSSPIFLDFTADRTATSRHQDSSAPPPEFLSTENSSFPAEQLPENEEAETPPFSDDDEGDDGGVARDIERLVSLLGLSSSGEGAEGGGSSSCDCSGGGFYSKVAGVKGPRCGKERRRLDGWIEYYYSTKKEPARLAHLLLAKAAGLRDGEEDDCEDDDDDGGFGRMEFPATIEEFLEHDPPQK